MKRLVTILAGIVIAAAIIIAPVKETKAATDGYVLEYQAQDLYNQACSELSDANRAKDRARDRVDELKRSGIGGDQLDKAYKELDECYSRVGKKEDKVSRAKYVIEFVKSRSQSEIFLAGMQEKFRNQASLKPMQDRIDGAKAIAQAQLTQVQIIQQAIQSQTALAQVNPAIFEQVNQLNASYQQELAQYQAEQQEIAHLQDEYNKFAATMPMPTMEDNYRLYEIRKDFEYCCSQFDAAVNE